MKADSTGFEKRGLLGSWSINSWESIEVKNPMTLGAIALHSTRALSALWFSFLKFPNEKRGKGEFGFSTSFLATELLR